MNSLSDESTDLCEGISESGGRRRATGRRKAQSDLGCSPSRISDEEESSDSCDHSGGQIQKKTSIAIKKRNEFFLSSRTNATQTLDQTVSEQKSIPSSRKNLYFEKLCSNKVTADAVALHK